MPVRRRFLHLTRALLCVGAVLLGGQRTASAESGDLVFGVTPGPYGQLLREAVAPSLASGGYRLVVREFSDYVQPNLALARGDLQANLFQHRPYLTRFARDKGLDLTAVINVPTAPLGIYSRRVRSLDELKPGDEVTLANDPTNLARALRLFAANGLVTLAPEIDPAKASERDIVGNPRQLRFRPIEAAQLPRSLDSVALSAVNGNFALAAGIPLASALITERLGEELKNVMVVRTVDRGAPWVAAVVEAIRSPAFRAVIEDPKRPYADFQRPEWYVALWPASAAR